MVKKLLLIFIVCLKGLIGNAQSDISFTELKIRNATLGKNYKHYKILEMNVGLQRISSGQHLTLHLDQDYDFTLKENRLLTQNYTATIKGKDGVSRKTLDELGFDGQYFMNEGISSESQLAFSMFEDR